MLLTMVMASPAIASDTTSAERQYDIVERYRELRKLCTITKGEARTRCFRDLKERTEAYQSAKRELRTFEKNSLVSQL